MRLEDRIHDEVRKLPEPLQAEVLNFVLHLASTVKGEIPETEGCSWTSFSLAVAMRGTEDEDTPTYSLKDLREIISEPGMDL